MDTSKEHIKMCEESDLPWNCRVGDYCSIDRKTVELIVEGESHQDRDTGVWSGILVTDKGNTYALDEVYPVFRQDQLQDMINGTPIGYIKVLYNNIYGVINPQELGFQYWEKFNSMEQLWLAFVMYELYKKKWDGNQWTL